MKDTSKLYADNLTNVRECREVSDSMETSSLVKNGCDDVACSEVYNESFRGRAFERIDTASREWSGIPAGTFVLALVTVSTLGLLTAMLIATIAIAV